MFGVSQFFDSLIRHPGVVIFRLHSMLTHCFFIHFSFDFFKMFLISVFTFLYLSLHSVSPFFFFSSLLLSHRSRMSELTHGIFMQRCLPMISLAVSVTAMFIAVIIVSMSLFSFSSRMSGANFPPIFAWKAFVTVGSFSFSRSYYIRVLVGFMILFRRSRKVIIRRSCSLPTSAPGKLHVRLMFTLQRKRFLTMM